MLCFISAKATNYYISSTGTNTNPATATSSNPLAFANFSAITLQAGDTVFFKSGDVFRGQLTINASGTAAKPIVFTAYGTGAAPVISGSVAITNFTVANNAIFPSGKVYKAFYNTAEIKNLIVNGVQMVVAQKPNYSTSQSFETVSSTSGTSHTGFKSSFATVGTATNWAGAKVCVRTSLWNWEIRTVENMVGTDSINYTSQPTSQPAGGTNGSTGFGGYGFFFSNKKELIDTANEWCYNGTDTVYYYPANNQSPSSQTIEGTVYKYGIYAQGRSYITISNLAFQNQDSAAIFFAKKSNDNIVIQNCSFSNQNFYGIRLSGTTNTVTQNSFSDCNGRALHMDSCVNGVVSYNNFKRIGVYRNRGITTDEDNLTAIASWRSNNTYIHHNTIDSTGYCGMRVDGDSTTIASIVEKNILSNCMLVTTDGGPLKTWGPTSRAIYYRYNFISKYEGNNAGATANTFHTAAIYYDAFSSGGRIEYNTIEQSNSTSSITNGFYNNSAKNMTYKYNVVYGGNTEAILLNDRSTTSPYQITGDSIYYNVFFGKTANYIQIKETSANSSTTSGINLGKYDYNYYFNPYSTTKYRASRSAGGFTSGSGTTSTYTLSQWRTTTGNDANAKEETVTWAAGVDSAVLFKNPTDKDSTVSLSGKVYKDLDGNTVQNSFVLPAWTSKVLLLSSGLPTAVSPVTGPIGYKVYPNPVASFLYINLNGEKNINYLSIQSASGILYYSQKITAQQLASSQPITVNVSMLTAGTYYVVTNKGAVAFSKF